MRKKGKLLIGAILILLVAFVALLHVQINFKGGDSIDVEYGESFKDSGVSACLTIRPLKTGIKLKKPTASGTVDMTKLGSNKITYTSKFGPWKAKAVRTVNVVDTTPPTIKLKSKKGYYTLPNKKYKEEGFKATDNYDGNLTKKVESEEKDGVVYYTVTDSNGNKATATREIYYDDPNPPKITLTGGDTTILVGDDYEEPGYSAKDDVDGDLTDKVKVKGSVDTSKAGKYKITYTVKDSYKNKAKETRTVTVIKDEKVIYLTFDDGPYKYTEKLLDVLDKYDAKVTFFVTNQYPAYQKMIKEEAKRGHAIGVHTYSHEYSEIYASEKAYFKDLNKMEKIIKKQTGSETKLVRFPGGSSNTVSRHYCDGIMSTLSKDLEEKGYVYFDWNVSSGDAGETTDTDQVYKNVVNGCKGRTASVVLQHDIKGFSVDAVAKILKWGKKHGYVFKSLDVDSPTAHQGINN